MARNTSFSLGDHFTKFIEDQVESGRYATASDVIRDALRLMEDREARLKALRSAIEEGEASGEPESLDVEEFLAGRRSRQSA